MAVALSDTSSKSAKTAFKKTDDDRNTLDIWKLYFDSFANYYSFFADEFLRDTNNGDTTLTDSCNAGIAVTNTRGCWGEFEVWLNQQGISKKMSVPMRESAVYSISSHAKKDWVFLHLRVKHLSLRETLEYAKECPTSTYVLTKRGWR